MCAPDWLSLREDADAAARAPELVERLRAHPGRRTGPMPTDPMLVRDLGCGTGSMGRWLAGRLPGAQHWVLHDRDPGLLARAGLPATAADGAGVTTSTRAGDVTELNAADLAGTFLVTASAVLDLLTGEEVRQLAVACVEAGCAALLTLTVAGQVEIAPPDPLDAAFAAAFDAHQRRSAGDRRLLGPDAGAVAVDAFRSQGAAVQTRPSPWRLGPDQDALAGEWLRGWVGAACEQQPDLEPHADAFLRRRLDAGAAGDLRVVVGHVDVLALPRGAS